MKPKEFMTKWKDGIMGLSTAQRLKAKLNGHLGSIFGMVFATVFLIRSGFWYFIFVMFFTVFLQCLEYINTKQMYTQALKVEEMQKELEEVIEDGEIGKGEGEQDTI